MSAHVASLVANIQADSTSDSWGHELRLKRFGLCTSIATPKSKRTGEIVKYTYCIKDIKNLRQTYCHHLCLVTYFDATCALHDAICMTIASVPFLFIQDHGRLHQRNPIFYHGGDSTGRITRRPSLLFPGHCI